MIKKIVLEDFGRFKDTAFELAPFTVIRGNNESGKTTLFDALFDNICGNGGRGSVWTRLKDRYGAERKSKIESDGDPEQCKISAQEFLGVYGVRAGVIHLEADESHSWVDLAKSSLFSGGVDPARLAKELARRNEYSGNVAHNNAVKTLLAELTSAQDRLAELARTRESILSSASEIERLATGLTDLNAKLEDKSKESKALQAMIKATEAAMEKAGAQEELEFLEKHRLNSEKLAKLAPYKEERLLEYDALRAEAASIEKEIDSLRGAQKSLASQAADLAEDMKNWGERRARAQKPADMAALLLGRIAGFKDAGAHGTASMVRYVVWGFGLLLAGAAFYIFRGNPWAAFFSVAVVLSCAAAVVHFMGAGGGQARAEGALLAGIFDEWKNAGLTPETINRETLSGIQEALIQEKAAVKAADEAIQALNLRILDQAAKIKSGESGIKELGEKKDAAGAKARAWLEKAGCASRDEYHSKVVEASECRRESAEIASKLETLLKTRQADNAEELKIKLRLLSEEHAAKSGAAKADKKALEAARLTLESVIKAKDHLAADKAAAEGDLEGLRGQAEGGLKGIPENMLAERIRIAEIMAKIAANRLEGAASAVASEIFAEMAGESTIALAGLAGEVRAALKPVLPETEVEITDLNLDCVKVKDAAGAMRMVGLVSSGTKDCFMLAARLALAAKARRGKAGILILDEPFYTLDERRMSAALTLLKNFQAQGDWQVILFTKDKKLSAAATAAFANGQEFKLIELG